MSEIDNLHQYADTEGLRELLRYPFSKKDESHWEIEKLTEIPEQRDLKGDMAYIVLEPSNETPLLLYRLSDKRGLREDKEKCHPEYFVTSYKYWEDLPEDFPFEGGSMMEEAVRTEYRVMNDFNVQYITDHQEFVREFHQLGLDSIEDPLTFIYTPSK